MLRHVTLRRSHGLYDFAHRQLPAAKQAQDLEPYRMGHGPHGFGGFFDVFRFPDQSKYVLTLARGLPADIACQWFLDFCHGCNVT